MDNDKFGFFTIHSIHDEDGTEWWSARDVSDFLNIENINNAHIRIEYEYQTMWDKAKIQAHLNSGAFIEVIKNYLDKNLTEYLINSGVIKNMNDNIKLLGAGIEDIRYDLECIRSKAFGKSDDK